MKESYDKVAGAPGAMERATEHKAHRPGHDPVSEKDKPVRSGNQITWPGQMQC
jgi:hypothetical protein